MSESSLRIDALTGRRVIVAPHRHLRPGAAGNDPVLQDPSDGNPFLEGNEDRTPGERLALRAVTSRPNQPGWLLRVVPNQYPAVTRDETAASVNDCLLDQVAVNGIHEVVIESPQAHRRLTQLSAAETARVLLAWRQRVQQLEQLPLIESVTVFRNEGFSAGASLPHVHSQILSLNTLEPQTELRQQRSAHYLQQHGRSLLDDLVQAELSDGSRIVFADSTGVVLCPWAGRVSWHVRVVPDLPLSASFSGCSDELLIRTAGHLHAAARAIEECMGPVAINVVLVQPPPGKQDQRWFLDLMPRSARMAGYELATDVDIVTVAPKAAAAMLRDAFRCVRPSLTDVIPSDYAWSTSSSVD